MATLDSEEEAEARFRERLEQPEKHARDERERLRQKYEEARKAEIDEAFGEAIQFIQDPDVSPGVRASWMKMLRKSTHLTLDKMQSTYEQDLETVEKQSLLEKDNAFKQFSKDIVSSRLVCTTLSYPRNQTSPKQTS